MKGGGASREASRELTMSSDVGGTRGLYGCLLAGAAQKAKPVFLGKEKHKMRVHLRIQAAVFLESVSPTRPPEGAV